MQKSYDVVIAGGAVMGSAAAYFLAKDPGFDGSILIIERDPSFSQCSTALSSSSIRHQFSNPLNVEISQYGTDFIRNFREISDIDGEGIDLGFHENGYLFLAQDHQVPLLKENHEVQKKLGVDVDLISPDEIKAIFPHLNTDDLALGSYGRSGEGWFDNVGLMQGMRKKARHLGADYLNDEVSDLAMTDGKVSSITLASGEQITCGHFINAAGTRGTKMAKMIGVDIPVIAQKHSLFVFACQNQPEGKLPLMIDPSGVFCRPEGEFFLSGCEPFTEEEVDYDDFDVVHAEFEEKIWLTLAERSPNFEAIKLVNFWAGHYSYNLLDQNAIVGPHPDVANFYFMNGFSGHGLQQAPAMGRGIAEQIIHGQYKSLDLGPLGFERILANDPFIERAVI